MGLPASSPRSRRRSTVVLESLLRTIPSSSSLETLPLSSWFLPSLCAWSLSASRSPWKVRRQGHEADCCRWCHQGYHSQGCVWSHHQVRSEGPKEEVIGWQQLHSLRTLRAMVVSYSKFVRANFYVLPSY